MRDGQVRASVREFQTPAGATFAYWRAAVSAIAASCGES